MVSAGAPLPERSASERGGRSFSRTSAGCLLLGLGFHLGVLLALLVVWVAAGLPLGTHLLKRAEGEWFREFLSEEDYGARYPVREHSPAALELDSVARRAGMSLAVTPEDRKGAVSEVKPEFREVWDFVTTLRKSDQDGGLRVPAGVVRTVDSRSRDLQAMEDVLLAGPEVDWETPAANELTVSWIGMRNVQSLLLVRSLLADQRGATAARDRALEASWRLNEGLWRRTEAVERLLAFSFDSDRNACLRRYRSVGAAWGERLSGNRPLAGLTEMYQAEARMFCRRARNLVGVREIDYLTTGELPPVGPRGWLFRVATAPYLRMSVAGYSDALRGETRLLREIDPCSLERDSYEADVKASLPPWNILARVAMPGLVSSWLAGRDAGLDDELTATVLEVRGLGGLRAERRRDSDVCSDLAWVARPAGGGRVRIEAEGELPPGDAVARPPGDADARRRLSYTLAAP